MAEIWTVVGETGAGLNATSRTLSQAGMVQPRLVFRNLAADTLTWSIDLADIVPVALDRVPTLKQLVQLYRNGNRFFRGHVTNVRQRGMRMDVTVSGPWWWLERVFLESTRTDGTGATSTRATYALPKQGLATSLDSLLTAARTIGVEMNVGTLANCFNAPEIKLNQMSFAQAIAEVVRITPDMVLYFDYSTVGWADACTCRRLTGLANGSAVSVTLDAEALEDGWELNPVAELQVQRVRVPYLERAANGAKRFATQLAGSNALGKVQIISVSGEEMDTFLPKDLLDSVAVQTVLWSSVSNATVKAQDSALAACVENYGSAPGAVDSQVISWIGDSNNRDKRISSYPAISRKAATGQSFGSRKYFISSTAPLPEWARIQLGAQEVTINGTWIAEWRDSEKGAGTPWSAAYIALRAGAQVGGTAFENQTGTQSMEWLARPFEITGYVIATPYAALTTLYKASDYDFVSPPNGFADGLLECQDYIPYEGTLSFMFEDCGATRFISRAVNVSNSQTAHATMRAMVAAEELDLDSGVTTLQLGAPMRFSYQELVNKMRGSSNDQIVYL